MNSMAINSCFSSINSLPPCVNVDLFKGQEAYNAEGYSRLVASLDNHERNLLETDIHSVTEADAKSLAERIHACELVVSDTDQTRETIVVALKALRLGLITLAQMATLHIKDAAIRNLLTHPAAYTFYRFVNSDGDISKVQKVSRYESLEGMPNSILNQYYNTRLVPEIGADIERLPLEQQKNSITRFFALTDEEYQAFEQRMEDESVPQSERYYQLITAPTYGCWSNIIARIQEMMHLFQNLDCTTKYRGGYLTESFVVVPSFSMLQALVDVKAETFGRKSVQLLPTYNRLSPEDYGRVKSVGVLPLGLYFPERSSRKRYNIQNPNFQGTIDTWKQEGPFASIIHDCYHALREIAMVENVAEARFRLALIAQHHPFDSIGPEVSKISNELVDGELVYSYPREIDTVFKSCRGDQAKKFGDLFSLPSIESILHPELRVAMINDMVVHADAWRENYQLGREDLHEPEQEIYDECLSRLSAMNI